MFVVQTRVGQPPGVIELTESVPLTSRDTPRTEPGVSCPFADRIVLTIAQPIIALSNFPYIDFPFLFLLPSRLHVHKKTLEGAVTCARNS